MQKITPFLWFVDNADEAAEFYISIFGKGSKILSKTELRDTPSGPNTYTMELLLNGVEFAFINGGKNPGFDAFAPSTSFVINCKTQKEVDHYWEQLTGNGGKAYQCGWLTDKYGVTWQVVPTDMKKYLGGKDRQGRARAMKAMLKMIKLDLQQLKRAYEGK